MDVCCGYKYLGEGLGAVILHAHHDSCASFGATVRHPRVNLDGVHSQIARRFVDRTLMRDRPPSLTYPPFMLHPVQGGYRSLS